MNRLATVATVNKLQPIDYICEQTAKRLSTPAQRICMSALRASGVAAVAGVCSATAAFSSATREDGLQLRRTRAFKEIEVAEPITEPAEVI